MTTKIELVLEIVWLALAMLHPIPSPTDGDGSVATFPHRAEIQASLEMIFHV